MKRVDRVQHRGEVEAHEPRAEAAEGVLALGRTGSTHLVRLLNAIPGYRISGETDNAWIHMGWFMESIRAGSSHGQDRVGMKRRPAVLPASAENATLCDMRRLMLDVHNPSPRARCAAAIRSILCCSGQPEAGMA